MGTSACAGEFHHAHGCRQQPYGHASGPCRAARNSRTACQTVRLIGGPNRLRFDFAHFKPLSSRDIDEAEALVNEQVRMNAQVQTNVMGIQEAVAAGALAFFGDKYGDQVRVVTIDTFSKELCGGTHCGQTGEIGSFRIISETGVAAGVRRMEALRAAARWRTSSSLNRRFEN